MTRLRLSPLTCFSIAATVALALRLHGLNAQPLWLDEIITLQRASLPLSEMVADSLANLHYPTFFALVSAALSLSPATDEVTLRLPAVLFGVLSAGVCGVVGRRLAGPTAGLAAGLLVALSPMQVEYAQEARSYTLLILLVLVSLGGLLALAAEPRAAALALHRPGARRGAWAALALGAAGAVVVQNGAALWLPIAAIGLFAAARAEPGTGRDIARNAGLAALPVIVSWLPWLVPMIKGVAHTARHGFWVPPPTLDAVGDALAIVYLFRIADPVNFDIAPDTMPLLEVALIGLAAAGAWQLRDRLAVLTALGAAVVLPPLALVAVSLLTPVLVPRYLLWSAPAFFLLVATGLAGLARLRPRTGAAASAAAAVAGLVNLQVYYAYETKPRWDLLSSYLAEHATPCDGVWLDDTLSRFVYNAHAQRREMTPAHYVETFEDIATVLAEGRRVWAVHGRAGMGPMAGEEAFLNLVAPLAPPTAVERFGRSVLVARLDPTAPPPTACTAAGL